MDLEGIIMMGYPIEYALRYYERGADELIHMDMIACLYVRNNLYDIVISTSGNIFVALTVGDGVRNIESEFGHICPMYSGSEAHCN